VVDFKELWRRSQKPEEEHYYLLLLNGENKAIDASRKGNLARFINHSCEPNCKLSEWRVAGALKVGFFALRDIGVGEEITYNYSLLSTPNTKRRACKCNSLSCKGHMEYEPEEGNARVSNILLFSYITQ